MMKAIDTKQYRIDEVAAEIALCKVLGIPHRLDEHYIARIEIAKEAVGVVVVTSDDSPIELDLEHLRELAVDIIVFAHVALPNVNLIGYLSMNSIRKLWARSPNSRSALAIDPKSLESVEELAMKVRREQR
jgi:hypothetical protein